MNIAIFVNSLAPRGLSQARFQSALFRGLKSLGGDRYHFMVFSDEIPQGQSDNKSFSYHAIKRDGILARIARFMKGNIGRILLTACRLPGRVDGKVCEAISNWMMTKPKYYGQLSTLNARLLWNMNQHELVSPLPYIRTIWDINHRIHSMYPEYSYTRYQFDGLDAGLSQSLARASYVVVGTEEGKRQLVSIYGVHECKVRVIPFPAPVLLVADECSQTVREAIARGSYLFYPARFWPHKNHVVILAAIKYLQENFGINMRCIFSGGDEGNLEYVLKYADKLGVRDKVEYVGIVSEEDLSGLYKGAFALVFASAVGPDNLPPLEAMSLGCPVIAAEVSGAREQYGDTALYFAPMNEHELAKRIKELLEIKSLRGQLVFNGRLRANSWTPEDYARKIISIFDEFALIARAWEKCDSIFT